MDQDTPLLAGVEIHARFNPEFAAILKPQALDFVAKLSRQFEGRRRELMAARAQRQSQFDTGKLPDFLPQTKAIRDGDWSIPAASSTD